MPRSGWLATLAVVLVLAGLAVWWSQSRDGLASEVGAPITDAPEAAGEAAANARQHAAASEPADTAAGRHETAPTGCDIEYAGYEHDPRRPLVLLALPAEPLERDARYTALEDRAGDLHAEVVRELLRRHGLDAFHGAARFTADAKGLVSARGLTPGPWLFAILEPVERADCFETEVESGRVHRVRRDWPGASPRLRLRGQVRDAQTRAAIAGARAGAHSALADWREIVAGSAPMLAITTDAAGRFTLDLALTMDRGSIEVSVAHADYLAGYALLLPSAFQQGEIEIDFELIATARAATLLGEVTDPTGTPLRATLRFVGQNRSTPHWIAMPSGLPVDGKTDAGGRFELRLPPTHLQLVVEASGHRFHRHDLALADGERRTLPRIVLEPLAEALQAPGELTVRVVDGGRQPVRASVLVQIQASTAPARRQRTRADGGVRFPDLPPGEYRLVIERGSYQAFERTTVNAGRETVLEHVVVAGQHFLGGTVVADGEAVAGVDVAASPVLPQRDPARQTHHRLRARTDAKGRFRLDGLPGDRVELLLSMEDPYVDRSIENVALDRDDHRFEFPVAKRVTVSGTVRDTAGAPIAGAGIACNPGPATTTGTAGDFQLLVPLTSNQGVRLMASHAGYRTVMRSLVLGNVGPDMKLHLDLVLFRDGELARIRGTVASALGKPLAGVSCTAYSKAGRDLAARLSGNSDSEGRFELAGVVPGEVEVEVEHKEHAGWRQTLAVRPGTVEEVAVRLEPLAFADVRLELRTTQGEPAAELPIDVWSAHPHRHFEGKTGRDGSFVLARWPLVSTDVRVAARPPFPGHRFWLEPERLRAPVVTLALLAGRAAISGVVRNAKGHPLAGVQVDLEGRDALAPVSTSTTTDDEGRFRFEGLAEGSYVVDAEGFERTRQTVQTGGKPIEIVFVR